MQADYNQYTVFPLKTILQDTVVLNTFEIIQASGT